MPKPTIRSRRWLRLTHVVTVGAVVMSAALPAQAVAEANAGARPDRDGSAGASGEAALTPRGATQRRVGPTIPGIDVSHWQGVIDWAKVAATGRRFAFLKATDDTNYVDPTFAINRAAARAEGLITGAYHFSRPDASPGDARREARVFVSVADPRPGDMLPVLDMETSRGLDQAGVTRWARTWVIEVRELTGVTPMVYTSPYGWMARTGDTHLVARDGAPLWVAHWGVSSPTLPAGDWDGHGWVVWQHTSGGHVRGIKGNVDLDKLAGASLGRITIRRLSIAVDGEAGTVTSTPAGLGCRSTCAHNVDPDRTVTLNAIPDEHAYFTGWTGACAGTAPTCTLEMRGNRSVGARFVTDITPPAVTITAPRSFTGRAVVEFDENVTDVTPSNVVLRELGGERVAVSRGCRSRAGATVSCHGRAVRAVTSTPETPLVPGRDYVAVVNPPGARPLVQDRVGNPAPATQHPFEAARTVDQTQAPVIKRPGEAWSSVRTPAASGGSFVVSGRTGDAIRLSFDGVGVDWVTVTGPNRGRAHVYVDGAVVRTVDLYADTRAFGVVRRFDGLGDGAHTLRIVVTGRALPVSDGTLVAIDRFDVLT